MEKKTIMLGMIVGSAIGGFVPVLWGAGFMSFSSIVFTAIGGFLGIFGAYKIQEI